MMRHRISSPLWFASATIAFAGLALGAGCDEPDSPSFFNEATLFVVGNSATPQSVQTSEMEAVTIAAISRAEHTISAAFEDFESVPVANALIAAHERGVEVRVIADVDRIDQPGFATLMPVLGPDGAFVAGDGAFDYVVGATNNLSRGGETNRMSHNFIVIDAVETLTLTGGFTDSPDDIQVAMRLNSVDFAEDFTREFNTMFSGTFATETDTFGGAHKSDTNNRVFYYTPDGFVALYFGPQERLMKRIIDDIYGARASVQIVTEAITNRYLVDALRYKATFGFDVSVVVDAEGVDVPYSQVDLLTQILASVQVDEFDRPDMQVRIADNISANIVIIDALPSRIPGHEGERFATRAYVMTHPMLAAESFVQLGSDTFDTRQADVFTDSHMFEFRESIIGQPEALIALQEVFEMVFANGEPR